MIQPHAKRQVRSAWFWGNLAALLLMAPLATVLFERHFKLYVNEVWLIGGALTLFGLVQLVWGVFASATGFDAEDFSRKWLNTPAATRLLIVAGVLLTYLWWSTASLYFEFDGDAARSYRVEVLRRGSALAYVAPFQIGATDKTVLKDLQLVRAARVDLDCQIVDPVGFAPRDCSIIPGQSTRVRVPGGFTAKEYHLVRLIPLPELARRLPPVGSESRSNFFLEVSIRHKEGNTQRPKRFEDLRKQTVDVVPLEAPERELVLSMRKSEEHQKTIFDRYLQSNVDEQAAQQFAAALSENLAPWALDYLREGDRVIVDVVRAPRDGESSSGTRATITLDVTSKPVQVIWLSLPS